MRVIEPRNARCAACHLCVLACAFHHEGAFGRRASSIVIVKNEAEGTVEVRIAGAACDGRPACDGCVGEAAPLCVEWCPTGALAARETVR